MGQIGTGGLMVEFYESTNKGSYVVDKSRNALKISQFLQIGWLRISSN